MSRRPLPEGTERVRGDYVYVKRGEQWEQKGRLKWTRYRGEIPDGHVIVFLDGDPTNCRISNLDCVPRATVTTMNRHFSHVQDTETRKTLILWCALYRAAKESKKGGYRRCKG